MSTTKAWNDRTALKLSGTVKQRAAKGLQAAADWAVRNQVRHVWPRWNANAGRFPYHVYLPVDDAFLSTSWNTARTVQGLLTAWQVTGTREYLEAAQRGLAYVKSLQVFSPEHPYFRGAFIEETPQSDHAGPRDGIECAQALMAHYFATRDETSLLRAREFLDFLLRVMKADDWPSGYIYLSTRRGAACGGDMTAFIFAVGAIPLVQAARVLNRPAYITQGASPLVRFVLDNLLDTDGAFRPRTAAQSHHVREGGDPVVLNDDGVGVAILSAWKATRRRAYLEAAVANGDWWIRQDFEKLPAVFAMPTCVAIFLADLARATADTRYTDFLEDLADRVFQLQIPRDDRPLVAGAFRGEDMASSYRAGSSPADYVSLRSVSYGLLALGKLAARNAGQWGPSYSAFGF